MTDDLLDAVCDLIAGLIMFAAGFAALFLAYWGLFEFIDSVTP